MNNLSRLLIELRGNEPLRNVADRAEISHTYLGLLEKGIDPRSGKQIKPSTDTLSRLAKAYKYPYEKLLKAAGYLPENKSYKIAEEKVKYAIADDPELLKFWEEMIKRDDLQLLFKQVRDMSPETIKRIIRYIKMVEDEEASE